MKRRKENIRNLTLLTAFAAVFAVLTLIAVRTDKLHDASVTTSSGHEMADAGASNDGAAPETLAQAQDHATDAGQMAESGNVAEGNVTAPEALAEQISAAAAEYASETVIVPSEETASLLEKTLYTVTEYESPVTMYASATVNLRSGAGTDYDKLGRLSWGSKTKVTGETDNGWYEVSYDGGLAFVRGDFMITELPGTPLLFVGDSRTVQLQMAVGDSDKEYIAEVGEGYSWFKNTALPAISSHAGPGTKMIINFGVNDLENVDNYIELVNDNIDEWTDAGITVYYASVTPVSSYPTVNNTQIEAFNSKLKRSLDSRVKWIDSYSYLTRNGFSTPDGLHYNFDTYKKLYAYYLSVIDQI